MKSETGKTEHKIYAVRNPWANASYKGKWRKSDDSWTKNYRQQVFAKLKVDPLEAHTDGIFFVDHEDFAKAFSYFVVGHYRPNYKISWYDEESDNGREKDYFFELDRSEAGQDLYLGVESYFPKQMPKSCHSVAEVSFLVYHNSKRIDSIYFYDKGHKSIVIENAKAGSYRMKV